MCQCHRGKWWQTMANWSEGILLVVPHASRESEARRHLKMWLSKQQKHRLANTVAKFLQRWTSCRRHINESQPNSLKESLPPNHLSFSFLWTYWNPSHSSVIYKSDQKIKYVSFQSSKKAKAPFSLSSEKRNNMADRFSKWLNPSLWPKSTFQYSERC